MQQAVIHCKQHPSETINNFCRDTNCLIGLCPTCIGQHTEHHLNNHTQPHFENIRQTYQRAQQEIKEQVQLISEDQERLEHLFDSMKEKRYRMKEVLNNAKEESIRVIEQYFIELQQKWQNQMRLQQKKHILHDQYKLQGISSLLNREMTGLVELRCRLSANTILQQLPRWQRQLKGQSQKFHQQTIRQIQVNEQYAPIIHYYPEILSNLTSILNNTLQLQFNIPLQRKPNTIITIKENSHSSRIHNDSSSSSKKDHVTNSLENQSAVMRKVSSAEKIPVTSPRMTQSALYAIPAQLANSSLATSQNVNKTPQPLFKTTAAVESPRKGPHFAPKYSQGIDFSKFTRSERPESRHLKPKKSGIMLFSSHHNNSEVIEKQNSKN